MLITEWIPFFLWSWGLPSTAYVAVQAVAAFRLRGGWRLVSLIPAVPMLIVAGLTISAYRQQSNLWPILLIFVSPLALVFVIVVWFAARHATRAAAPTRSGGP